jgi:hypothetical protein
MKFKHTVFSIENGNLIMFYHSDKSEQFWLMEVISKLNFLLIVYFNEALPEQMAKPKMIETLLFIRQHNTTTSTFCNNIYQSQKNLNSLEKSSQLANYIRSSHIDWIPFHK